MAVVIPYKIDNEDREKWAKRITAGHATPDLSRINKHDYASKIGQIVPTVKWLRVDDGDVDKMLKMAALIAT